jgi:large subunit ribosomal protein L4
MKVASYTGGKKAQVEYDEKPFGGKVMHRLLKDAVVMYQANQRLGTAKTKTRAEVHGSHAKPWKQKHTGRARAGDKKSPIWRKGGTVFGPVPHDFSWHMPAQMRRVALRSAIAGKIKDEEFVVAEMPRSDAPSAKAARKMLADLGGPKRTLLVLSEADAGVWKSFRNFPGVRVRTAAELNALDVVSGGLMVAEQAAMDALVARVGSGAEHRESKSERKVSKAARVDSDGEAKPASSRSPAVRGAAKKAAKSAAESAGKSDKKSAPKVDKKKAAAQKNAGKKTAQEGDA